MLSAQSSVSETFIPAPVVDPTQVKVRIIAQLALDISAKPAQVQAAVQLMDEGATVPFIARYRKEVTGGLDDIALRTLDERLVYLREMEERRAAVLANIAEQGKLTQALASAIDAADNKQRLEDLYAPYKQKRRTRAQIAKEAGIEPLADTLLQDASADPQALAPNYFNAEAGFADAKTVLDGARDILAERFAEDADLVGKLRDKMQSQGFMGAERIEGVADEGEKFRDYYTHSEPIGNIPGHRALALLRGRQLGILSLKLGLDAEQEALVPHPCVHVIAKHHDIAGNVVQGSTPAGTATTPVNPRDKFLADTCRWTWRVKLLATLESELMTNLREKAEAEAINVFGANLRDLLLAAPAGPKAVLGLDPGLRTGVKVAAIDTTGKVVDTDTIYPHAPRDDWHGSIERLAQLCRKHSLQLVAIGNGTASRETERLAADLMKRYPELGLKKIVVSEAGASVYSASELASKELPGLDVSLRGAVSIARRLQDPLAELVKIDPKSIGVGQYQHDVNQRELARKLQAIIEDCVNAVGVDVNTASPSLLANVSGLNATLAKAIVDYRDSNGAFSSRDALRQVPRFGDKTFEQAAGFLRVREGSNPLDASGVHPEAYVVVQRIMERVKKTAKEIIGQTGVIKALNAQEFTDDKFGLPTVKDILAELEKPGRDPRPEFTTATFMEGVEDIKHLRPGMVLEGVVTNVANFGAFVDVGVHQDGLVHVSALSTKFIKDPREAVRVGQTVKVKVMEVDVPRRRIGLTMRMTDEPGQTGAEGRGAGGSSGQGAGGRGAGSPRGGAGAGTGGFGNRGATAPANNAFADAFAKLKR